MCVDLRAFCDRSYMVYKPVRSTASIKRKFWAPELTIYALLMQLTVQVYTSWARAFWKKKKNPFQRGDHSLTIMIGQTQQFISFAFLYDIVW